MDISLNDDFDIVENSFYCDICNENYSTVNHFFCLNHKRKLLKTMAETFLTDKKKFIDIMNPSAFEPVIELEMKLRNRIYKKILGWFSGERVALPTMNDGNNVIYDKHFCWICNKEFISMRSHIKSSKHKEREYMNFLEVAIDESDDD